HQAALAIGRPFSWTDLPSIPGKAGKPLAAQTVKDHLTALRQAGRLVVIEESRGGRPAKYAPASEHRSASDHEHSDATTTLPRNGLDDSARLASEQVSELVSERRRASALKGTTLRRSGEIGRASCRERVESVVVGGILGKE